MDKITNVLNTDYVSEKARTQIEVECELKPDSPVISLLGVTADAIVLSSEGFKGEVSVNGRVNFKALYVSEEDKIASLDYFSDFRTKIYGDIEVDDKLFGFGKVVDVEVVTSSNEMIKARAVVEVVVIGASRREVGYVDGDNLCKKTADVQESVLRTVVEGIFDVEEDYESGERVDKIVLLTTDLVLKEAKPSRGSLLVSGTAFANITYESDSGIKNLVVDLPFCEELVAEDVTPDDDLYLYGYIKDARIILTGDEADTNIGVEVTVAVRVPVFEMKNTAIPVDAFCVDRELKVVTTEGESYKKSGSWNYEERLSGSAILPEDAPSIGKIITLADSNDTVTAVNSYNDRIEVLGSFTSLLIYEDVDGLIRPFKIELPYDVSFEAVGGKAGGETYVRQAVCEVTAVAKRARDVEIMYVLKIYAYQCVRERFNYISDIEDCEDKIERKPITIYKRRDGEDKWSVAKALRIDPENLDFEEERFIVTYRQIE